MSSSELQLEPVDQLFRGPYAVVALVAGGKCGAGSPGCQLGTLQLGGGGAQLHSADADRVTVGVSPRRVRARVRGARCGATPVAPARWQVAGTVADTAAVTPGQRPSSYLYCNSTTAPGSGGRGSSGTAAAQRGGISSHRPRGARQARNFDVYLRAQPIRQSPQNSRVGQARLEQAGRARRPHVQRAGGGSTARANGARWAAPRRHTHGIARAGREQGAVAEP